MFTSVLVISLNCLAATCSGRTSGRASALWLVCTCSRRWLSAGSPDNLKSAKQNWFYGNAVYPTGGSPWSMRLQIAFRFPKFNKEQEKMMMEMKLNHLEQEQQKTPPKK
jgi:hypothetical protein